MRTFKKLNLLFLLIFCYSTLCWAQKSQSWLTFFEKTGGMRTSEYKESVKYWKRLADSSSMISYSSFGKSEKGKDLPLLILDRDGYSTPEEIKQSGKVVVLVQAAIHAGETCGKDAGVLLFRDFFKGNLKSSMLKNVSVIYIPIFNVDGFERFGEYNRINQNGPKEMGWRANAQNLNLNRDYLKAESSELKSWHKLFNTFQPDFFIDCHSTDGADYQYVATYAMEVFGDLDAGLVSWQKNNFIPYLERKMGENEFPIFPYVSFRNWHDPRSGLYSEVGSSMLSQAYTANVNRPGLLVETHMLKPYRQRVDATYQIILEAIRYLNSNNRKYKKLIKSADVNSANLMALPLTYRLSKNDSVMVKFKGVDYDVSKSDLTGGDWFVYHTKRKRTYKLPYFNKNIPDKVVKLPKAYIVPAQWKKVIDLLSVHGIRMNTLNSDTTISVELYRIKDPKWGSAPFEGHIPLKSFDIEKDVAQRTYSKGSVVIPTNQAKIRIIANLLEPEGDGSLLFWGYFNSIFEQKEYGESYVIEPLARKMLKENPKLKEEFELKKKNDKDFANNTWSQINWFYAHSKYWDKEKDLYPIGRLPRTKISNP
ncbi:MAG: M14 family metallopeptidase [Bacteroidales bacterium]